MPVLLVLIGTMNTKCIAVSIFNTNDTKEQIEKKTK